MKLILVRHGETQRNREGLIQGISDLPLNEKGRKQAEALGRALAKERIDAIYSSPLKRALETARAIARFHRLGVRKDEGLREMDVGELDGLSYSELMARYPEFMKKWMEDVSELKMPGGEYIYQLQERVWASIQRMVARHPQEVVVAATHNFAIQSIICKTLDAKLDNFRRVRQDVGAFSVLEFGETGPLLLSLNERCHWVEDHRS